MRNEVPRGLAHHIRHLAGLCRVVARSDADLLTAFAETGDQESFAALVVRHGNAVWAACRHVLDNDADAEDAFQATFITLARKAATLRREELGGWLRKVAHEVALNAGKAARRREAAHRRLCERATAHTPDPPRGDELRSVVREELAGLPERLRVPLALFYLDGKPQTEVAALLGITDRGVRNRLAKGLAALRERLHARGLVVSAAAIVAVLGAVPAALAAPSALVETTTAAALAVAGGARLDTPAVRLALQAAERTGWRRSALYGVLLAAALGAGTGGLAAFRPPAPPAEGAPSVVRAAPAAEEERKDQFGDPLPPGALVRVGTLRLRSGQTGDSAVAISPDNKTIYSAHLGDEVRVWDANTGKEGRPIPGPSHCERLALSGDGRRLVAYGRREVWCWDLGPKGAEVRWTQRRLMFHCTAVALSADGRTVACGASKIHLFDAATGEPLKAIAAGARKLTFSPNGRLLASWGGQEKVFIWDVGTGEKRHELVCGTDRHTRVNGLAFSRDGGSLATVTEKSIAVWDVVTGAENKLAEGVRRNTFVAFEPDGKVLIEAGGGLIRFRDPATGKECRPAVAAPQLTANVPDDACRLSADGTRFVSADRNTIGVWDTRTGRPIGPTGVPTGKVMSVAFSPDGQNLAVVAMSLWEGFAGPQVYDARTGRLVKELRTSTKDDLHLVMFRAPLRFAPGRELLLSGARIGSDGGSAGYCFVWNGKADAPTIEPAAGGQGKLNLWPAPSPDGRFLAAPQPGGGVVLTDRATGKGQRTLVTKTEVTQLAFSSNGRYLAGWSSANRVGTATVWDVRTGERCGKWTAEGEEYVEFMPPLAVSPDGKRVAIGTDSRGMRGRLRVWDVASGAPLWEKTGAANPASAVAFSPDGRVVVSGGDDGTVRMWEAFSGQERLRLTGHRARVCGLDFAPDGFRLASGSADSTALVWDTRPARPTEAAAGPAGLWAAMTGNDAGAAHRAIVALADAPKTAVPLLREKLKPAPLAAGAVERWIGELGADEFAVREAATAALAARGEEVEPALRKALGGAPSAEAKTRLTRLITRLGPVTPQKLGAVRGVEALERMAADPAARKLLDELAAEPVESFVGREARAARDRLTTR